MQSSTAVLVRALVMLACLIAIPLAAMFGKSLPDLFKAVLGGRSRVESSEADSWGEAPSFELLATDENPSATPPRQLAPDRRAEPLAGAAALTYPQPRAERGVMPAGYETAVPSPSGAAATHTGGTMPGRSPLGSTPAPPDAFPAQAHSLPVALAHSESPSAASAQTESVEARLAHIEQRLRQLGATRMEYYWDGPQFYRFGCDVSIGGDPTYIRHFQATNFDRLQAMNEVLRQIEIWRGEGR